MYLESFRHLIEIEGLKVKNQQEEKIISNENKRISDLLAMREKRVQVISELKEKIKSLTLNQLQNSIEDASAKLVKMKGQMDLIATEKEQVALEHQIASLEKEIAILEERYFSHLELGEEYENEIKEGEQFLAGSLLSLENIKKEVDEECLIHQQKINQNNLRINSLLENCHPSLKSFYLELEKKFKTSRPCAHLIDRECASCHMLLDNQLKSTIEKGITIETCGNCGRLLIPESTRIY